MTRNKRHSCTFWNAVVPGLLFTLLALATPARSAEIDLLVVYTPSLENNYGGYDGVEALVRASVESSNISFENSNIDIELRLVGLRKIDYDEDDEDMGVDLDHLRDLDGVIDETRTWRNEVGADIIYMFRSDSYSIDHIGKAWILEDEQGEESYAYGVISGQYALSDLVLQHEIGHNLGAAHDPDNTTSGGIFSYSYGHRFKVSSSTYRSVMAYAPGSEINYFSSPNLKYQGSATGTAQRDNARTLRNTAATVASYRGTKPIKPTAIASYDDAQWYEDTDNDGFETVSLDGSDSKGWPDIEAWTWTWTGGSASGEIVNAKLPLGTNNVTLTVTGTGGQTDSTSFQVVVHSFSPINDVFTTQYGLFLQKQDGRTTAAGYNGEFRLGVESNQNSVTTHTRVRFENLIQVSGNGNYTLFLLDDGSVYGTGYYWSQKFPEKTADGFTKIFDDGIVAIATGNSHALFLDDTEKVWGIGSNRRGQLGIGTEIQEQVDLEVVFDSNAKEIRAGSQFSSIIGTDGSLWVSGQSRYNPFPGIDNADSTFFTKVEASGVIAFDSGSDHIVYLKDDSSVWTTGYNNQGQLGAGAEKRQIDQPLQIVSSGATSVEAGVYSTYVKMNDGVIWATGANLVSPQTYYSENIYTLQPIINSRVSKISASYNFLAVLLNDGSVWVGGQNDYGQFGLGNTDYHANALLQTTPVTNHDYPNTPPIAQGSVIGYPIDEDGNGYATVTLDASKSSDDWRIKSYLWTLPDGQMGEQTVTVQLPVGESFFSLTVLDDEGLQHTQDLRVDVKPFTRPVDVFAGKERFFIIKEDGSLWCGGEADRQLFGPNYETNFFPKPLPILDADVIKVVDGYNHCLVLKTDGSVWGTGENEYGQIGLGEQTSSKGFTQLWPSGAVDIAAGSNLSYILLSDGTAYGMGANYEGQIADLPENTIKTPYLLPIESVAELKTDGYKTTLLLEDGKIVQVERSTEEHPDPFKILVEDGAAHLNTLNSELLLYTDHEGKISHKALAAQTPSFGNYLVEPEFDFQSIIPNNFQKLQLDFRSPLIVDQYGACFTFGQSYPRSSYFPIPSYQNDYYFQSSVLSASKNDDLAVFLLENGSVWLSTTDYRYDSGESKYTTPILVSNRTQSTVNERPVAKVLYPEKSYLLPGTASKLVTLDGTKSTDDKFIKSWRWTWKNRTIYDPIISEYFEVGDTQVVLTVTDTEGLFHTHSFTVTVEENSHFSGVFGKSDSSTLLYSNGFAMVEGYPSRSAIGQAHTHSSNAQGAQVSMANISKIENYNGTTGVIDKEGALWLSGNNTHGELGIGYKSILEPFHKVLPENVIDFSFSSGASFACLSNGSLWGTGQNRDNRFATDSMESTNEWFQIMNTGVEQVETNGSTVYVKKSDGSLWMFGGNYTFDSETLPHGAVITNPIKLMDGAAKDIICSTKIILVVKQDGSLWGAGKNIYSSLGFPAESQRSNQFIKLSDGPVTKARTNGTTTIWLMEDGSLWGIASSYNSLLGLGDSDWSAAMEKPRAIFKGGIRDFSLNFEATTVITDENALYSTKNGQFGYYSSNDGRPAWYPLSSLLAPQGPTSPTADAGEDRIFYTQYDYGFITLDGSSSQDDWAIEKWQWDLNGRQIKSSATQSYVETGTYTATLTVTDFFGSTSTDTINIELRKGDPFQAWLHTFLNDGQIEALDDEKNNDFDLDGHSNYIEFLFKTDPTSLSSKPTLAWNFSSDYFYLQIKGSNAQENLPILYSTDLIIWHPWTGDEIDLQSNEHIFLKISNQQY